MLKKTVTYKDFNGTQRTEDFWFHMTTAEMMELQVSKKEGFGEWMQKIIESEDREVIMAQFKKILLAAVGQRSEDGRLFKKNDEIRDEFSATNAYSELFVELATDADAGAKFVSGIVPEDFAEQMTALAEKLNVDAKPTETRELPATGVDPALLRPWYDYSREDLLDLKNEAFEMLFNDLPTPKPQLMLSVAMERRNKQ